VTPTFVPSIASEDDAAAWEALVGVGGSGGGRAGASKGAVALRRGPRPRVSERRPGSSSREGVREAGSATAADTPADRSRTPYKMVYLPGVLALIGMLRASDGVVAVTTSRVRSLEYTPAASVEEGAPLTVAFAGFGRRSSVRLLARGGTGWRDKTQQLFIETRRDMPLSALREVLRGLASARGFELVFASSICASDGAGSTRAGADAAAEEQAAAVRRLEAAGATDGNTDDAAWLWEDDGL